MADEPVEFASPEWMAAIADVLVRAMAGLDTGGRTYTVSEEFTDPPAHLGAGPIGWYFRVTDGSVEIGPGALQEGDLVTVVDYQACLPVARLVYGSAPDEEVARVRGAARATGSRRGDETALPPDMLARLLEVHNEMARRTA